MSKRTLARRKADVRDDTWHDEHGNTRHDGRGLSLKGDVWVAKMDEEFKHADVHPGHEGKVWHMGSRKETWRFWGTLVFSIVS